MSEQPDIVVLSAVRTAVGTFGGGLKDTPPTALAAQVVREAVTRSGLAPDNVEHVVFGNVIHTEARDAYLSRVATVEGGLPIETPAFTLNRLCGSGLQAIVSAAQQIETGHSSVTLAGGAENMSRAPYWLTNARWGQRMGDGQMMDAMLAALHDPFENIHMGVTAENIAEKWGISREAQDAFAVESHQRAARAWAENRFDGQITPVVSKTRKGEVVFDQDEHIRHDASIEGMAKLKTVFKKDGTVTAGNASGINDAASALILADASRADALGAKPLARLIGYSHAGVEPAYMGIGPVPAVKKLLAKTGLGISDFDLFEVNEAFASQALAVCQDLDLPLEKTNPNGSGISIGHPIGATGTVIATKAIHELIRTGGKRALCTMCIGGGQGIAVAFERV